MSHYFLRKFTRIRVVYECAYPASYPIPIIAGSQFGHDSLYYGNPNESHFKDRDNRRNIVFSQTIKFRCPYIGFNKYFSKEFPMFISFMP